jgi:hypothetical protein
MQSMKILTKSKYWKPVRTFKHHHLVLTSVRFSLLYTIPAYKFVLILYFPSRKLSSFFPNLCDKFYYLLSLFDPHHWLAHQPVLLERLFTHILKERCVLLDATWHHSSPCDVYWYVLLTYSNSCCMSNETMVSSSQQLLDSVTRNWVEEEQ